MCHTIIYGEPGISKADTLFFMLHHKDTEREYGIYLTKDQAKDLGNSLLDWAR